MWDDVLVRILHYALGFPPYRTGGLTTFCTDLMQTQAERGHTVALLWPGRMNPLDPKPSIRRGKDWKGIGSFELVHPLPVPLDEGILDIGAFTRDAEESVYLDFLGSYRPDVIHVHTLMGIHPAFFRAARRLSIRTVFTAHDYFGICPKVRLYRNGSPCDEDHGCADCAACNASALSLQKIGLLQSPLYRILKDTGPVNMLRRRHRHRYFEGETRGVQQAQRKTEQPGARDYQRLREYYLSMLEMADLIHFNSTLTQQIYRRYFQPRKSAVISITHRGVEDRRKEKAFDCPRLRVGYLGPANPWKGFSFLIQALDRLWAEKPGGFELHLYTETQVQRPYITRRQRGYSRDQLEGIFGQMDVLVVPSQWYETFGFTVLEGLSYGVPVIVTDRVGAKDILEPGAGLVTSAADAGGFCRALAGLDTDSLRAMHQVIAAGQHIKGSAGMAEEIERQCYGWNP